MSKQDLIRLALDSRPLAQQGNRPSWASRVSLTKKNIFRIK